MASEIELVGSWIAAAERVTVLTGAGISTDSGIPDFRGPQGVWTKNPAAEKTATLQNYLADPDVRRTAWRVRAESALWSAQPNAGHRAIVEIQRAGKLHALVTQNIDELHQKAGTDPALVIEVHGTAWWTRCLSCADRRPMADTLARVRDGEADPPCLVCGGILKSDTISFGQSLVPEVIDRAMSVSRSCEVLLAVGSTLSVYPAASCVPLAAAAGARVAIINGAPTEMDHLAGAVLSGPISELLPAVVAAARDRPRARQGDQGDQGDQIRTSGVACAQRLYHAALPDDWAAALESGTYEVSTRGALLADVGFIHAAYENQVEGVVNQFYDDVDALVLLVIDRDELTVPVHDESPSGDPADEHYPHIYGPIPVSAVVESRRWRKSAGGPWALADAT